MAVETVYGVNVLAKGQAVPPRTASFQHFNNPYKAMLDVAVLPAAASIGSTIEMASIKPDAVLSQLGVFSFDAMGAGVTLSIGLKDDAEIGLSGKEALINAASDVSSAGSIAVGAAIDRANWFKPLWELAGLTEKPSKNLTIVATQAGAATTPGGDVAWEIPFVSY